MVKRFAQLAGLTLLLGVVFVPQAHAQTRFSFQMGPIAPIYGAQSPGPGYVWQPGYYAWTGYDYRWVAAGWIRSSHGRSHWSRGRDWDRYRDRSWNRHRGWGRDRESNRDRDRRNWDRDDGRGRR